jgi:hypothetical protein
MAALPADYLLTFDIWMARAVACVLASVARAGTDQRTGRRASMEPIIRRKQIT